MARNACIYFNILQEQKDVKKYFTNSINNVHRNRLSASVHFLKRCMTNGGKWGGEGGGVTETQMHMMHIVTIICLHVGRV